jgi:HK97 family phage major capsid protein
MLLAQIESEKKQALAAAEKVMKAAEAEEREMTAEERESVQEHLNRADELTAKLQTGKADTSLRERLEAFKKPTPTDASAATDREQGRKLANLTLGQQVVASAIGTAIKAGAFRARGWNTSPIEFNAEVLSTTEGQAGGAALITPDYRPGIWQILTQIPTVRSLLASGTTDSNQIVYFVESLATNAAAAVEELAAKPESALRFTRTTDDVKKVATWIPASTEMLEDFRQIASYIDARLRIFLRDTVDNHLLNGDGNDGELLGLRNRANLTTLLVAGGTENVMDAIHRQITQIIIGSFVMPDGIAMNPLDWETAVLSKENGDGTGAYIGASPFAAMQARSMWGLPVVITQRMTAGRAFIGAFGTMAQVFSKGGISVSMSNSHEDYFTHNKVAILAEERLALAVYRPKAFGEVDLSGAGESL